MKRCGWCCVELRFWQMNHCHKCSKALFLNTPSPPFARASRIDSTPDTFVFGVKATTDA